MGAAVAGSPRRAIENIIPILRVENLAVSCGYYQGVLGFEQDWSTGDFAGLSRDGWRLYLCQGGQGSPGTWVWVGVRDVDQVYQELRQSGARILTKIVSNPWAREFQVGDPDGHILRFGGEPQRPSHPD